MGFGYEGNLRPTLNEFELCFGQCYSLNCVLPKDMFKSQTPISQNTTLFGNRIVAHAGPCEEEIYSSQ